MANIIIICFFLPTNNGFGYPCLSVISANTFFYLRYVSLLRSWSKYDLSTSVMRLVIGFFYVVG
jgi:hypothetical protein